MADKWRGNDIVEVSPEDWRYVSDGVKVPDDPQRACGHCGLENTAEGHDGCLGTLPGVVNACCGHGAIGGSYIVLSNGVRVEGRAALTA